MSRGVIAQLRDFVPIRPLTREEALHIAERQAARFLELVGVTEAPVPDRLISGLPRINVRYISPFPASGATHWVDGQWSIVLNGSEPVTRQRFSLAHELKHIIDHTFIHVLYEGVQHTHERRRWVEQICDYFAGCLLVPRPMLQRAWDDETHDIGELARRFHVSQAAIRTRLAQTGISRWTPRCEPTTRYPVAGRSRAAAPRTYSRRTPR